MDVGTNATGDVVGTLLVGGGFFVVGAIVGATIGAAVKGGVVGGSEPGGKTFPNETESIHTPPKIVGGAGGRGSKLNKL